MLILSNLSLHIANMPGDFDLVFVLHEINIHAYVFILETTYFIS